MVYNFLPIELFHILMWIKYHQSILTLNSQSAKNYVRIKQTAIDLFSSDCLTLIV